MQRAFNIEKWKMIPDGGAVAFAGTAARRVRLDVNAPFEARLSYADSEGEVTFLAKVYGRDVIEFAAYGEFSIIAEGGDVWFYTIDGEVTSFTIPDAVILTKIIERRPRNPELELMNYHMKQNMERRLAAQRAELEELWNKRDTAARAAAAKSAVAGNDGGAVKEPAPKPASDKPSGGGAPADGADGSDAPKGA